jgi:radical SAM superfamily enzyme YgiQ (UPF0313 family)
MKPTDIIWIKPSHSNNFGIQVPRFIVSVKRRIVLVDLYWTRDKDPRVPLGHASLLAALRCESNLEVLSVVLAVNQQRSIATIAKKILQLLGKVAHKNVDIAIGAYIWNEAQLQKLLPLLRARGFTGRIILGGPQISYVESGLEELYPDVNAFIRGNAETALCALALNSGQAVIEGVHYAGERDINQQAKTLIDELPSPWLNGLISLKDQAFLRWETQRGCQFKCSFCQHRQPDAKVKRDRFSTSRILQEIDHICRMGVKDIAVLDPVFNSNENPGHALMVLQRFTENSYPGKLSVQCRAEFIDDAFLDAAQKLDICLEFGLQTIHKREFEAIDRTNNMKKIDEVLIKVRQRQIQHEVSLIFGLPEQTLDSFKESVQWCLDRQVPTLKAFPLMLLRGTKLEQQRQRWNLVVQDAVMPTVIESSTFCHHEWRAMERISEALSRTEGNHPIMNELLKLALVTLPDESRWQPIIGVEAI